MKSETNCAPKGVFPDKFSWHFACTSKIGAKQILNVLY